MASALLSLLVALVLSGPGGVAVERPEGPPPACGEVATLAFHTEMYSAPYHRGTLMGELPEEALVLVCARTEDPPSQQWAYIQIERGTAFYAWIPAPMLMTGASLRLTENREIQHDDLLFRSRAYRGCYPALVRREAPLYHPRTGQPARTLTRGARVAVCGSERQGYLMVVPEDEPKTRGHLDERAICFPGVAVRDAPLRDFYTNEELATVPTGEELTACEFDPDPGEAPRLLVRYRGILGTLPRRFVHHRMTSHYYSTKQPFGGYSTCVEQSQLEPGVYAWQATATQPVEIFDLALGRMIQELDVGEIVVVIGEFEGWLFVDVFGERLWVPGSSFTAPRRLHGEQRHLANPGDGTIATSYRPYRLYPPLSRESCLGEATIVDVLGFGVFHVGDAATGSEAAAPLPLNPKTTLPIKCLRVHSDDTCAIEEVPRVPAIYLGHEGWIEPEAGVFAIHRLDESEMHYWARVEVPREDFSGIEILDPPEKELRKVVDRRLKLALDVQGGASWSPTGGDLAGPETSLTLRIGASRWHAAAGVEARSVESTAPIPGFFAGPAFGIVEGPLFHLDARLLAGYRARVQREAEAAFLGLHLLPLVRFRALSVGVDVGSEFLCLWNQHDPWRAALTLGMALEFPLLWTEEERVEDRALASDEPDVPPPLLLLGPKVVGLATAWGDDLPATLGWGVEIALFPTRSWWGISVAALASRDIVRAFDPAGGGDAWHMGGRVAFEVVEDRGGWRWGGDVGFGVGRWARLPQDENREGADASHLDLAPGIEAWIAFRVAPVAWLKIGAETAWHMGTSRGHLDQALRVGGLGALLFSL